MATLIDMNSERVRHPEKAHKPDTEVLRKPKWIRVKAPTSKGYAETRKIVKDKGLVTVCEEAACPNIGECWEKSHATFMVLGEICVIDAKPDVFNHNLETVPRLYLKIRPGARYYHSLRLLERVKERDPSQFTKSGLMVGLGETKEEIMQVMDDMRSAGVDFLTIGQYLQPTRKHAKLERFVTPEEFKSYETIARAKGFLMVSASPLTRSSYHADSDFAQLRAARAAQLGK